MHPTPRRCARSWRQPACAAETDLRTESVSKKIRDGEVQKVPFLLVVGDREVEQGTVTLRTRGSKDTASLALAAAVEDLSVKAAPPAI
jgi:threonyl-tRNA synthetase